MDVAASLIELGGWRARAYDIYQGGYIENGVHKAYSESYYNDIVKGYDLNEALIHQWNATADHEVNTLFGGFLGGTAGLGLVAATAPAWLAFAGYEGSAGTIVQGFGLKAGIGLSIELGGNYATGSDTTIGGLAGTTLASVLIAPSATRIYGIGAKGLTIAGGASGFGGNLTGQFLDYYSTGRNISGTDLLLSTGFGALGGRFAAPLQDRFGATSLLFQKWSPYVDELYNAPATVVGGATDITRKVIWNNVSGR